LILKSNSLPPLFLNRKTSKIQNEFASRMDEEQSYLFLESLASSIKCDNCGERFYSQVGYEMHRCKR
jgi:hypothetical protein